MSGYSMKFQATSKKTGLLHIKCAIGGTFINAMWSSIYDSLFSTTKSKRQLIFENFSSLFFRFKTSRSFSTSIILAYLSSNKPTFDYLIITCRDSSIFYIFTTKLSQIF